MEAKRRRTRPRYKASSSRRLDIISQLLHGNEGSLGQDIGRFDRARDARITSLAIWSTLTDGVGRPLATELYISDLLETEAEEYGRMADSRVGAEENRRISLELELEPRTVAQGASS